MVCFPDFRLASSSTNGPNGSTDTLLILRQELQKCLATLRDKRGEISSLRAECDQKTLAYSSLENRYELARDDRDKIQVSLARTLTGLIPISAPPVHMAASVIPHSDYRAIAHY